MNRNMKKRTKYVFSTFILIYILHYFGVFTHIFEKDFASTFDYPINEDITPYIEQLKNNDTPDVLPINLYNYTFLKTSETKCKDVKMRLLILVKSAIGNFNRRMAIRNTFGYERRFSDVNIRTIFLLGVGDASHTQEYRKYPLDLEYEKFHDIVQANFTDNYFNNTIKTMMGFKWAMNYCQHSKFFLFTDDDMYISIKNVLRFVRNPSHYPEYVEESLSAIRKLTRPKRSPDNSIKTELTEKFGFSENTSLISDIPILTESMIKEGRVRRQIQNYELPDDVILYTGFMFESPPHRHKSSKWYISLDEYPWHMWPPYISAGAYIISREALINMYYASYFTAHFRFDDIYLGILAKKCLIKPFHCKEFYFYKKDYNIHNYRYVIASHGYDDPKELINVWNEQKSVGNA